VGGDLCIGKKTKKRLKNSYKKNKERNVIRSVDVLNDIGR